MNEEFIKTYNCWKCELRDLKKELCELGDKPDSFKYNLLATEALILSSCMLDLMEAINRN